MNEHVNTASDSPPVAETPRVSIVIPAYNRERYVGATIDGVLGQTFTRWELVVSDDGSTDGTAGVARRYAEDDARIRVISGPNGGVASARNRGLAATDPGSGFVIFLDSDDVWEPHALDRLLGALDARPESSSAHGLARCIDADGRPLPGDDLADAMRRRTAFDAGGSHPVPGTEPTSFAALVHHNWIVTPGTHLIRRAVIDQVGPFDPTCEPADDWDMAVRVSRIGPIAFVDEPVLRWRRHDATLSETSRRWRRAGVEVWKKMFADPSNSPDQARIVSRACRDTVRRNWRDAWREARSGRVAAAARDLAKAFAAHTRFWWWAGSAVLRRWRATRTVPIR